MSANKKSVKELPLSVIPKDLKNGKMAPVFRIIVTDHSGAQGNKKDKKRKIWKSSTSAEVGWCDVVLSLQKKKLCMCIIVFVCLSLSYV